METEIRVMWPEATGPQRLEEAKENSRASRGSTALLTASFQTLGLQTCEGIHFCCFKRPPVCGTLL